MSMSTRPGNLEDILAGLVKDMARMKAALSRTQVVAPVIYTATGTFDKADYPGLRAVMVKIQGAGGAGGGAGATAAGESAVGGGGGGGGYVEVFLTVDELAASEAVVVGAGGTGVSGSTGNDGGDSSFDTLAGTITAGGGDGGQGHAGGTSANSANRGAGGLASGGDLNIPGSPGQTSGRLSGIQTIPANGGSCVLGSGANAIGVGSSGANAGQGYGGGGGGARNGASQSAIPGGAGASGIVIIDLYY